MRTLRLYSAGLTFVLWAALVELGVGYHSQVVAGIRLVTCGIALLVSFRESVQIGAENRRRRHRGK